MCIVKRAYMRASERPNYLHELWHWVTAKLDCCCRLLHHLSIASRMIVVVVGRQNLKLAAAGQIFGSSGNLRQRNNDSETTHHQDPPPSTNHKLVAVEKLDIWGACNCTARLLKQSCNWPWSKDEALESWVMHCHNPHLFLLGLC